VIASHYFSRQLCDFVVSHGNGADSQQTDIMMTGY